MAPASLHLTSARLLTPVRKVGNLLRSCSHICNLHSQNLEARAGCSTVNSFQLRYTPIVAFSNHASCTVQNAIEVPDCIQLHSLLQGSMFPSSRGFMILTLCTTRHQGMWSLMQLPCKASRPGQPAALQCFAFAVYMQKGFCSLHMHGSHLHRSTLC